MGNRANNTNGNGKSLTDLYESEMDILVDWVSESCLHKRDQSELQFTQVVLQLIRDHPPKNKIRRKVIGKRLRDCRAAIMPKKSKANASPIPILLKEVIDKLFA